MKDVEARGRKLETADLSDCVVGFRIYKIGPFDSKSLERLNEQVRRAYGFYDHVRTNYKGRPPQVAVITNDDMAHEGKELLYSSGLMITECDRGKAQRRADHAKNLLGPRTAAEGTMSYADMLNTLFAYDKNLNLRPGQERYIFASASLANNPEALSAQIIGLKVVSDEWERKKPGKLAMVGSFIQDVHDESLIAEASEGRQDINLGNLSSVFPNNSTSLVFAGTRFSGLSDDGIVGRINVAGETRLAGGNEDFLYGFKEMLFSGRDCILLLGSSMTRDQKDVARRQELSYRRRQEVYRLYAKRLIIQAFLRARIALKDNDNIETVVERTIDNHLFFARIGSGGQPEVILTQRQKEKSIESPI